MESKSMLCGLCKKEVHPLNAHMGRINGKLDVFYIECWNEFYRYKIQREKDELDEAKD